MPEIEIDLNPVTHITVDAVGKPGQRIFYLQGRQGDRVVTLLIEKVQIQSMALGVEEFLSEIQTRYPHLSEASAEFDEKEMHIRMPVDPLFRIGDLGLAYDVEKDMLVLVARELAATEGTKPEDSNVVRFWCTRSQVRIMCRWGLEVARRGRPICPQCGEPMDPQGHFCPKKNGHRHD